MALVQANLTDDELIVRVVARPPSEINDPVIIGRADFARRLEYMSGISLWRARSRQSAINGWPTKWPKGTLICDIGTLKGLGLEFFDTTTFNHFTVRCDGCDLNINQKIPPLCRRTNGSPCDFDLRATAPPVLIVPVGLLDKLTHLFSIDLPLRYSPQ